MARRDDLPALARAFSLLLPCVLGFLSVWWTLTAFLGGRMPLLGIDTDGGVGFGLLWLFVIDPIVMSVAVTLSTWLAVLVFAPFLAAGARRTARFHAGWTADGEGATFVVERHQHSRPEISWTYDPGVQEDLPTSMLVEDALTELEISLGLDPTCPSDADRGSWHGPIMWMPPLPTGGSQR